MTSPEVSAIADLAGVTGRWELDPAGSSAEFRTRALWILPVTGKVRFLGGHADATVAAEADDRLAVEGKISLDATSVTTGNERRDAHLRTADFFDRDRSETIDFVVSGVRLMAPGRVGVEGTLIVNRMARSLAFEADVERSGERVTLHADITDLDRTDYGMEWARFGASVHNRLIVHASFVRATPPV